MVIALMWEEDEQMSITGQVIIVDMKGTQGITFK